MHCTVCAMYKRLKVCYYGEYHMHIREYVETTSYYGIPPCPAVQFIQAKYTAHS